MFYTFNKEFRKSRAEKGKIMEEIEEFIPDMKEASKLKLLDNIIYLLAQQYINGQVQEPSADSQE